MTWRTKEELSKIVDIGEKWLNEVIGTDADDMNRVCKKLEILTTYLSAISSGKAESYALLQIEKMNALEAITDESFDKWSKTVQKDFIDGKCAEMVTIHNKFVSLEDNFGTQIGIYRSILSFRKAEITSGL